MIVDPKDIQKTLKALREKEGLTIQECANRLGSDSKRAWAAYEDTSVSGRTPGLDKLAILLDVLGYRFEIRILKRK